MSEATTQTPPPSRRKRVALGLLAAALLLGGGRYLLTMGTVTTDDAVLEAQVVPIAPKVSGYVAQLLVADNQHVQAGDVLLQIAPEDYQFARDQAAADLKAAQARLNAAEHSQARTTVAAPSDALAAAAQVASADAAWRNAARNLQRLQAMGDLARSRQSLDAAVADEANTRAKLDDARARSTAAAMVPDALAVAAAEVKELQAAVARAEAVLGQAEKNLADTKITAPIAGRVTKRTVELGAYLQPGQQVMALVGDSLWVTANFKETQLAGLKPGLAATIVLDAYPDKTWQGKVDSIQAGSGARFALFPPENATGNFVKIVQRVPVKITFDTPLPADIQAGPGMSVVPLVRLP